MAPSCRAGQNTPSMKKTTHTQRTHEFTPPSLALVSNTGSFPSSSLSLGDRRQQRSGSVQSGVTPSLAEEAREYMLVGPGRAKGV